MCMELSLMLLRHEYSQNVALEYAKGFTCGLVSGIDIKFEGNSSNFFVVKDEASPNVHYLTSKLGFYPTLSPAAI